jgi:hypothetical protein
MFQSLDEQIKTSEGGRPSTRVRLGLFAGIAIILVVLFGGLYFAIVSFE